MQDKKNRDIVDSQGNVIKSIKDNKTKQFLKDNIWNILSTGLATSITLVEMINLVISKNFSVSCSNFYGIDGKYFDGTEMFKNKLIFIFCALALFAYPFIFSYINKKMNSKLYVIFTFIITVYIMFFQNLSYTINLIEIIPWAWLRRFIDNYATIGVFLIVDIVIAYFIIIRNFFWKNKKYSVCGKIILAIALIHNILNGLLSSKEMTEAAAQLGMKESDTYRVVDFHTITKNVQRKYTKEQLHEVGVIEGELMHLLPDALIYRNMDQIVMIQQVDSNQTELEYQKEMEEIEEVIQRSILYRKKDTDFQIGIGKSVEGYQRLKESYYEASQAIKYIEIIRLVTGDKNKSVVHYSNLGFFQIFGKVDDMTELERCIPETLKKLYLYDDEHKGELITTLQMYLRNNQSIKKTAGAMFVHYRTISYRLEKIKQISGINFDNANEVLAVSNGLIIYKMLKEIE